MDGACSITEGISITSPSPITSGLSINLDKSSALKIAPFSSKDTAGTQEGIIKYISKGLLCALSSMKDIPSIPSTLAISCGSATTVVTPLAKATFP